MEDLKLQRRGIRQLKASGKGGKIRYVPLHPAAGRLVSEHLEAMGHSEKTRVPFFARCITTASHDRKSF